jgi:hypothetical protein
MGKSKLRVPRHTKKKSMLPASSSDQLVTRSSFQHNCLKPGLHSDV